MLGAIAGDMIGSAHERNPVKTVEFELFTKYSRWTDDTVLTVATAEAILRGRDFASSYRAYYRRYPNAGYGAMFRAWGASDDMGAYGSFGNGSAMRVSPVGWAFGDLETVLGEAAKSAAATHDHPEGIKGAQAVAAAVFLARSGEEKQRIAEYVTQTFGFVLSTPLEAIRPSYGFDVTCRGSVPQALRAFLESRNFEEAVRLAVSLGGDADTQACMAGAVAEAFYRGVPQAIAEEVLRRLDKGMLGTVREFREKFMG
jgi:ADP-ribosylglycohydrolase